LLAYELVKARIVSASSTGHVLLDQMMTAAARPGAHPDIEQNGREQPTNQPT
jgi:hypothetical protein